MPPRKSASAGRRAKSRQGPHPAADRPPMVSACLIVRDEEANLDRCLSSLQGAVDEIVVVDTGSVDDTVQRAVHYGAKIAHFTWCDDFAAARNESLRQASGDWVLYIDADEALAAPFPGYLRMLCSDMTEDEVGAVVPIDCPADEQGVTGVVGEQWRLLRNHRGIHFVSRIHEQLRLPQGVPVLRSARGHELRIRHWGYVPHGDTLKRKSERNRRLLELAIRDEPDQPAHLYHLGRQYIWEEDASRALPALEAAMALWRNHGCPVEGYVPSMFSTAALAALKLSQFDRVLAIEAAVPPSLVSSELLYVSGIAAWRLGDSDSAIERLRRARTDPSLATGSGGDPSTASWRPLVALADIYEGLGKIDEARDALRQANEIAPHVKEIPERLSLLAGLARAPGPLITACMIVRNEAENLRRRLPAVRSAVDELIVVDTGSSDDTVKVARALGAEVHAFPWCDDFAAARNESLRHATGAWLLWIDADDELVETVPGALRRVCAKLPPTAGACLVPCQSVTTNAGEIGVTLQQVRLLRNQQGLRFRGRVHEQPVLPESGPSQVMSQNAIIIRHWGYVSEGEVLAAKLARNRRLLQLSLAEEPEDPFHHYSLGKQLVWEHDYRAALEALQQSIELWRRGGSTLYPYVPPLFATAVCAALNLGSNEEALTLEAQCPANATSADLLYYAAIACQRLGRHADAIERLLRASGDPAVKQASETDPSMSTWRPRMLLGQIYLELNRRDEAFRYAMEALDLMPDRADVLYSGAAMAANMNHPAEATKLARRLIASSEDNGYKIRARELLISLGQTV